MKRPYVDMWSWINQFYNRALMAHDNERMRLLDIHGIAFDLREKNPQQALALLKEGLAQAERLQEPWIAISFECRMVEILMFSLARYEEAVEMATKLIPKMSQEAYVNFPMRAWAFINLVIAYFELDALSYKDEILAMIETLETRMPIDADIHQRLYYYRSRLWLGLREYDKAMTDALTHMEMSAGNAFRAAYGYDLLTHLYYIMRDDRRANDYAHLTQETSEQSDHKVLLANSYYWQALFLVQQDQTDAAHRMFLRAAVEDTALNLPQELSLLCGQSRYYEAKGEVEKSLAMWDDQIRLMDAKTPHRQSYFYIFLYRSYALRLLGRLTEADISQTRQAALRLGKPERYLPLVDKLQSGSLGSSRY
jgi:hypothetical protein